MEIVLRRDPKNQNNKMTLPQVQALTPSFNWSSYFAAMQAPASPQYMVISPGFFRGWKSWCSRIPSNIGRRICAWSTLNELASSLS